MLQQPYIESGYGEDDLAYAGSISMHCVSMNILDY